jgi:hypothetical protein
MAVFRDFLHSRFFPVPQSKRRLFYLLSRPWPTAQIITTAKSLRNWSGFVCPNAQPDHAACNSYLCGAIPRSDSQLFLQPPWLCRDSCNSPVKVTIFEYIYRWMDGYWHKISTDFLSTIVSWRWNAIYMYECPLRQDNLLFSISSRPDLETTMPHIQWIPGLLARPGIKLPGHELHRPPPSNVEASGH